MFNLHCRIVITICFILFVVSGCSGNRNSRTFDDMDKQRAKVDEILVNSSNKREEIRKKEKERLISQELDALPRSVSLSFLKKYKYKDAGKITRELKKFNHRTEMDKITSRLVEYRKNNLNTTNCIFNEKNITMRLVKFDLSSTSSDSDLEEHGSIPVEYNKVNFISTDKLHPKPIAINLLSYRKITGGNIHYSISCFIVLDPSDSVKKVGSALHSLGANPG
ncbi:MAG TPA: hypothetical protein ENJ60_01250 [Aeromonadales bacterium]|nr:hypothetical protein [Aeromonadales bacterium]